MTSSELFSTLVKHGCQRHDSPLPGYVKQSGQMVLVLRDVLWLLVVYIQDQAGTYVWFIPVDPIYFQSSPIQLYLLSTKTTKVGQNAVQKKLIWHHKQKDITADIKHKIQQYIKRHKTWVKNAIQVITSNTSKQVDLLLGVKSYGEEMSFKKSFKNRQRRGLFNVQRQIIP